MVDQDLKTIRVTQIILFHELWKIKMRRSPMSDANCSLALACLEQVYVKNEKHAAPALRPKK